MSDPPNAEKPPRGNLWTGVLIGIVAVLAILALIAAFMFLAMGRCPMCGRMISSVTTGTPQEVLLAKVPQMIRPSS